MNNSHLWRTTAAVLKCWAYLVYLALLALLVLLGPTPARAGAAVTYSYSGVVDDDDAQRGWVSFTGLFTFDSTAVDPIADPSTADYQMFGAPFGMSVVFNDGFSHAFNTRLDVLVSNNLGGADQWGVLAGAGLGGGTLGFTVSDFTQAVFGGDSLPLPLGGLLFSQFGFSSFSYETSAGLLNGNLTDFHCLAGCDAGTAVPEPATGALALLGLALTVARQRRSSCL